MNELNSTVKADIPLDNVMSANIETTADSNVLLTAPPGVAIERPVRAFLAPKNRKEDRALTKKNRAFLELLCAGKGTLEAYHLAGYKGTANAAYVLRHQLKNELSELLELEGIDRTGLKIKAKQLLDLGLPEDLKHLSPKMYLETLRFLEKLTSNDKQPDIKISPFVIETNTVNIAENTTNSTDRE